MHSKQPATTQTGCWCCRATTISQSRGRGSQRASLHARHSPCSMAQLATEDGHAVQDAAQPADRPVAHVPLLLQIGEAAYKKDRFLGSGGFSQCFAFRHTATSHTVAVKVIPKKKTASRIALVQNEIGVHGPLAHPHVRCLSRTHCYSFNLSRPPCLLHTDTCMCCAHSDRSDDHAPGRRT